MSGDPIRDRRVQYETDGLDVADVADDPMEQWRRWHNDALQAGLVEPNAMTLAPVDVRHAPDSRIVLVRGADERGLTFYTNYESAKSRQLETNPFAAATFGALPGITEKTLLTIQGFKGLGQPLLKAQQVTAYRIGIDGLLAHDGFPRRFSRAGYGRPADGEWYWAHADHRAHR